MIRLLTFKALSCAIAIALTVLAQPVLADGWSFEGTMYTDRGSGSSEEENVQRLDLRHRLGFGLSGTNLVRMDDGHSLNLGFSLSNEHYPGHRDLDRYRLDLPAQYIIQLSTGHLKQLRFAGEVSHVRSRNGWVFNRIRLGTALRMEPVKRHTLQLRTRIGFRDQNEGVLANYDQSELLLDAMHLWVSEDRQTRTATTMYFETRNADQNRFSYTEAGFRFAGSRVLNEDLRLIGRVAGHVRDYDEGGRHDKRFRGSLGLEWQLNAETTIDAYAGLQGNKSTFESKDHQGPVFGIQLTRGF